MGGIIGNCINKDTSTDPPGKSKNNPNSNNAKGGVSGVKHQQPANSRVNETDKAILEVKARLKKLKTYTEKLNIDLQKQTSKIQDHLKAKEKQRALIALKHKKFIEKELDKAMGAQTMLQQTISNIESAQMDVNVYEAMKKGDQVLTELQKQASLEDFEELYEKHQEHEARQEMERELFGQVLNEDELQDELDKLDAIIFEEKVAEAGSKVISKGEAQDYREKHGLNDEQEEEEEEQVSNTNNQKRQMAYA